MPDANAPSDTPLFSIIIPVYNRADLIERTLESIEAQTCRDFEVIAVDDGSKDDSLEVLRRHEPRIRVVTHEGGVNKGLGATRNRGMEFARGRYMAWRDSDDLWLPWTLESFKEAIAEHNDPPFVMGNFVEFAEESEFAGLERAPTQTRAYADYLARPTGEGVMAPSCAMGRADVVREAGGFAELRVNCEDLDMYFRLCTVSPWVRIESPVTLALRRGHASMVGNLKHTLAGITHVIDENKADRYPGGAERAKQRLRVLGAHTRPATVTMRRAGDTTSAWTLYKRTLGVNTAAGRWKYLAAFPVQLAWTKLFGKKGAPS